MGFDGDDSTSRELNLFARDQLGRITGRDNEAESSLGGGLADENSNEKSDFNDGFFGQVQGPSSARQRRGLGQCRNPSQKNIHSRAGSISQKDEPLIHLTNLRVKTDFEMQPKKRTVVKKKKKRPISPFLPYHVQRTHKSTASCKSLINIKIPADQMTNAKRAQRSLSRNSKAPNSFTSVPRAHSHLNLGVFSQDDSRSVILQNKPEEKRWRSPFSPVRYNDQKAQSEKPRKIRRKASKKKVKSIINRLTKLRISESMKKSEQRARSHDNRGFVTRITPSSSNKPITFQGPTFNISLLNDPKFKPQRFRAKPYTKKSPFMTLKSTKQLTIPMNTLLNTEKRSRSNSNHKSKKSVPPIQKSVRFNLDKAELETSMLKFEHIVNSFDKSKQSLLSSAEKVRLEDITLNLPFKNETQALTFGNTLGDYINKI